MQSCGSKHDSFEHSLSHAFVHVGLVPCRRHLASECLRSVTQGKKKPEGLLP